MDDSGSRHEAARSVWDATIHHGGGEGPYIAYLVCTYTKYQKFYPVRWRDLVSSRQLHIYP